MKDVVINRDGNHWETLRRCNGYYCCPNADGIWQGPLVGYAGKYQDADGTEKQWVGHEYANFAKTDEHPRVMQHFCHYMADCLTEEDLKQVDFLCGMPIGGYNFSYQLGLTFDRQVIKAEKKVIALATPTSREKTTLFFGRHSIEPGARYAIAEDVCNNFSTTEDGIATIQSAGGKVTMIVCLLNRSLNWPHEYHSETLHKAIPVKSLVRKVIEEYKQDDPVVAEDVKKGNVVWKPKDNWDFLMEQMGKSH
jgi:orotate phosphoribosyltransferase